ncbi:hypothetical protein [Ponticoccus litoralis]|uniref:Uncharacterized protein n=1 Tax=Ponticoccus litoralis TaxID=422297 RepID=A0AAW9SMR4_9RHOB
MLALAASAEPVRLATWHGDFSRKGPGLLLKELESGGPDLSTILGAEPDVLLLTDFDYDAGAAALGALQRRLKAGGLGPAPPVRGAAQHRAGDGA